MDGITIVLSIIGIVVFLIYLIISSITEYCRRNSNKSLLMQVFSFFWFCFVFVIVVVIGFFVLIMRILINI